MLTIRNVSKTFNKGTINQKQALNRVNLELQEGDFVTIIGSNGAGKSTLLNAVAGVFPVDEGQIFIDGQDITPLPAYKRASLISRVFQDPMLGTAASMTIEENMVMAMRRGQPRRLRRAITAKERAWFQEQLAQLGLGLENRLTQKVSLLSGGQRQALTLLMASLQKPRLLLLDEHTAALDPKTEMKVIELTRQLARGLTVMMITHNLDQALSIGNRTIMMHEGRIVLDIKGAERDNMTIPRLLDMFGKASGTHFNTDRTLLAQGL